MATMVPRSLANLWQYRDLIAQMTKREVIGRYRGSIMGLAWSFFNPILMLVVYTFVFGFVFKARWGLGGSGQESKVDFAATLFVGLIIFGLFSECANRAPSLIIANTNYVKKIIFPLEILPVVSLGAALFHCMVSLAILFIVIGFNSGLHPTSLLLPIMLLPLILMILGISWILASSGVFIRDISQTIGIITTVMSFLAPVFYPITALPEQYRPLLMLNPLTLIIEQARAALIFGTPPDWIALAKYAIVALGVFFGGLAWFQKTRRGFADVL